MFKMGDELVVNIDIGTTDQPYVQTLKVQIIGFGNGTNGDEFLCYVPCYEHTSKSFKLTRLHQKHYDFDDKFLNEMGTFVKTHQVMKHVPAPDGAMCYRCGDFVMWAEQIENFLCRDCKENPYR